MTYVRRLRLLNGLAQATLAQKAYVSKTAVYRFENGKTTSAATALAVAEVLGVRISEIATVAPDDRYLVALGAG